MFVKGAVVPGHQYARPPSREAYTIWLVIFARYLFTVSRTVELSSEGVSKLVLMLESIGGTENSPDEHVCETTEAWHGLACTVLLRSAFAYVFGLVFRFSRHSIYRLRYQKVSMHYGRQTLG